MSIPLQRRHKAGILCVALLAALVPLVVFGFDSPQPEPKSAKVESEPDDPLPSIDYPPVLTVYQGKTFREWRERLHSEISPTLRKENLKALRFFARHGWKTEAAVAIFQLAWEYNDLFEDMEVPERPGKPLTMVRCKHCQASLLVPDAMACTAFQCPKCAQSTQVPPPATQSVRLPGTDVPREKARFRLARKNAQAAPSEEDLADYEILDDCRDMLAKMGPSVLPVLRAGLKKKDLALQCLAVEAIVELGPEAGHAALGELLGLVKSSTPLRRELALAALSEFCVKEPEFFRRRGAGPRTAAALLDMVRDYDDYILTVIASRKIGSVEPAESQAPKPEDVILGACAELLALTGQAGLPALRQALKGDKIGVQFLAAEVLAGMGTEAASAGPELLALSTARSPLSRECGVRALACVGHKDPKMVAAYRKLLAEGSAETRKNAFQGLENSQGMAKQTVAAILDALGDEDAGICEAALGALTWADAGPKVVPALIKLLARKDVKPEPVHVQLQYLGPAARDALPVLLEKFESAAKNRKTVVKKVAETRLQGNPPVPVTETRSVSVQLDEPTDECLMLVDTLGAIGPAAAAAVPTLKKMLGTNEEAPAVRPMPIRPQFTPAPPPAPPIGPFPVPVESGIIQLPPQNVVGVVGPLTPLPNGMGAVRPVVAVGNLWDDRMMITHDGKTWTTTITPRPKLAARDRIAQALSSILSEK